MSAILHRLTLAALAEPHQTSPSPAPPPKAPRSPSHLGVTSEVRGRCEKAKLKAFSSAVSTAAGPFPCANWTPSDWAIRIPTFPSWRRRRDAGLLFWRVLERARLVRLMHCFRQRADVAAPPTAPASLDRSSDQSRRYPRQDEGGSYG